MYSGISLIKFLINLLFNFHYACTCVSRKSECCVRALLPSHRYGGFLRCAAKPISFHLDFYPIKQSPDGVSY